MPKTDTTFLNRVLDSTPPWAMASMGVMVGATVCLIAVINLADLKPISLRLANAYAQRIEMATSSLENVVGRLQNLEKELTSIRSQNEAVLNRVANHEGRLKALEDKHK